jgi:hypothetical protein
MWPELQQPWYFHFAVGLAADHKGYIYIAEMDGYRVQKFTSDGQFVSRWGSQGYGPGEFQGLAAVAVDSAGYVYVYEGGRIQKFTSDGQFVSRWGKYGDGIGEFDDTEGAGLATSFDGYVYVADSGNYRVQRFDATGRYISEWGEFGTAQGKFGSGLKVAVGGDGSVYVLEKENNRVQKFTPDGEFVLSWGRKGSGQGEFNFGGGESGHSWGSITVDANGNVYVGEVVSQRIQKFTSGGVYITQWGAEVEVSPNAMTVDSKGNLHVSMHAESRIQQFTLDGQFVSEWANISFDDGWFRLPLGVATDSFGNVYVADDRGVQRFRSNGEYSGLVSPGGAPAESWYGSMVATDNNDYLYVIDTISHRVQKYSPDGVFVSEWGSRGGGDSQFDFMDQYVQGGDVALDESGNVYVADYANHRLQKFTSDGQYLTQWGSRGSGNGEFEFPYSVDVSRDGFVYVADAGNDRIQKFTTDGAFVAKWGITGPGDGQFHLHTEAIPGYPIGTGGGLALDVSGNVYVADTFNNRVQKFTPEGTFLAKFGQLGSDMGFLAKQRYLDVGDGGKVYVADTNNHRIQVFAPSTTTTGTGKAIIVAGSGPFPGNNIWDATQMCANYAYRALVYQGYSKDTIYYLSANTDLDLDGNGIADDVDENATSTYFQDGITSWAQDAEDLFIYMVGHGGDGTFRMGATELLQASDLDSWLDEAQETVPGTITLVYDACRSGSFLSVLDTPSGKERILATSAGANEEAIFGSLGTISFSHLFWARMFNGDSFYQSFYHASNSLGVTYHQTPLLDGNGNGIGNEREDQEAARAVTIGNETRSAGDIPVIGSVSPAQTLDTGNSATIYAADVIDADGISRVWAVITPPGYSGDTPETPVTDIPTIDLSSVGNNRYEATYSSFTLQGTYNIAIYAADSGGVISLPKSTTVTQTEGEILPSSQIKYTGLDIDTTGITQPGESVTFTANATVSNLGNLYYRFDLVFNYGSEYYDPINYWQTIQDFSSDNTCTHTFIQAGSYVVVAWASPTTNIPGGAPPIMGRSITVGGDGGVLITNLDMDVTGTVRAGDSVTFAASAVNSAGGDVYYRFDLIPNYGTSDYDPNSNYQTIQDFSTSGNCTYNFTESGSYIIVVWASSTASIPTDIPPPIIGGSVTVE